MDRNWKKIFKNLEFLEPPEGFSERVFNLILKQSRRASEIRFRVYTAIAAVSLISFIFAIKYILQEFSRTGFYEYLSLAFSDGGTVLIYWKEFTLTLAESLPAVEITLVLTILLAFLGSVSLAIKNNRTIMAT